MDLSFLRGLNNDDGNVIQMTNKPIDHRQLTKPYKLPPKSRVMNNSKNQTFEEGTGDIKSMVRKIIDKKPSVNKVRKAFSFIVDVLEEDSDSDF